MKILTPFSARDVGFVWASLALNDVMEAKVARFPIRDEEFGLGWHVFE